MNRHRWNISMAKNEKHFPYLIRRVQRNTPLKQLLNRIMRIYPTNNEYD